MFAAKLCCTSDCQVLVVYLLRQLVKNKKAMKRLRLQCHFKDRPKRVLVDLAEEADVVSYVLPNNSLLFIGDPHPSYNLEAQVVGGQKQPGMAGQLILDDVCVGLCAGCKRSASDSVCTTSNTI